MPKKTTQYKITETKIDGAVDHYDGRENLGDTGEGTPEGKWNKVKSRPAVVISKWNIRKAGGL